MCSNHEIKTIVNSFLVIEEIVALNTRLRLVHRADISSMTRNSLTILYNLTPTGAFNRAIIVTELDVTTFPIGFAFVSEAPWPSFLPSGISTIIMKNSVLKNPFLDFHITRLAPFGAFVELSDDINGLIHTSEIPGSPNDPSDVLKVGEEVEARVIEVNQDERRIGLSLLSEEESKKKAAESESEVVEKA